MKNYIIKVDGMTIGVEAFSPEEVKGLQNEPGIILVPVRK